MASLKYSANSSLQTVTLGAGYTSGSGTMTLTSGHGARLPATGDFWLAYDDGAGTVRLFKVTARSTDTLTVVSDATEGSGDGNITSGETLRWALTAAALDQLRTDICGYGTFANLPATCKVGDQYYTSDSIYTFVATATNTWTPFINGERVKLPPTSGWTWDNQGSSTVDDGTYGYLHAKFLSTGGVTMRARYRTAPSAPYIVKFQIDHMFSAGTGTASSDVGAAIGFRDSGGKIAALILQPSSGNWVNNVYYFNSATSFNSTAQNNGTVIGNFDAIAKPRLWVAIEDNNTNIIFYVSINGVGTPGSSGNWQIFGTFSRTAFMASGPNAYLYGSYGNTGDSRVQINSLEEL